MSHKQIYYSDKYDDDKYEYRHVMLPKDIAKRVPKTHLMSESEWRNLGVQQSQGWVHYMIHQPGTVSDANLMKIMIMPLMIMLEVWPFGIKNKNTPVCFVWVNSCEL
uniref:Cyclin-dependent kinases regulatory subunit n=1 Tax=Periophthalmus magnuspinnatus TaxID=409849 RepID=A0A3B3Z9L4_9GOBI